MKKVLHLTLKGCWYDEIESGEKREEYRTIKPFWINRLCTLINYEPAFGELNPNYQFKDFTHVRFARGGHFHPKIKQMELELHGITVGLGMMTWGAEKDTEYFILQLGEITEKNY